MSCSTLEKETNAVRYANGKAPCAALPLPVIALAALTITLMCVCRVSTAADVTAARRIDRLLLSADLVIEGVVKAGGTFDALIRVDTRWIGRCPDYIEINNMNKHPWNTSYHALQSGRRVILFLCGTGARFTPIEPGTGVYVIHNGSITTSISDPPLRYPIDANDFRLAIRAIRDQYAGRGVDADTLRRLRELSQSPSSARRHFAVEMSGILFARSATNDLMAAARLRNPKIRQAAVGALGHMPGDAVSQLLADRLEDDSPTVAYMAARALMERGDTDHVDALIRWYRNEMDAVTELSDTHYRKQRFVKLQPEIWRNFSRHADGPVAAAMMFLSGLDLPDTGGSTLAVNAYRVIGQSHDESLIEPLVGRLRKLDEEKDAAGVMRYYDIVRRRAACADALGKLAVTDQVDSADQFDAWWKENREKPRAMRAGAAVNKWIRLIAAGTPNASLKLRHVVASLNDDAALIALGRYMHAEPVLCDPFFLAETGSPLAIPWLALQSVSDDPDQRRDAAAGMAALCNRHPELAPAFDESIAVLLLDGRRAVRQAAIDALTAVPSPLAAPILARGIAVSDFDDIDTAVSQFHALTGRNWGYYPNLMPRESDLVRINAFRWARATPAFIPPDARIQDMARAMRRGSGTPPSSGTLHALSDRTLFFMRLEHDTGALRAEMHRRLNRPAARALNAVFDGITRTGDDALADLFLSETDPTVRVALLWAMGRCRVKPPISPARQAETDNGKTRVTGTPASTPPHPVPPADMTRPTPPPTVSLPDTAGLADIFQDKPDTLRTPPAVSDVLRDGEEPLWLIAAGAWLLGKNETAYQNNVPFRRFADSVMLKFHPDSSDDALCVLAARMWPSPPRTAPADNGTVLRSDSGAALSSQSAIRSHPFRLPLIAMAAEPSGSQASDTARRFVSLFPKLVPESQWPDIFKARNYDDFIPIARGAALVSTARSAADLAHLAGNADGAPKQAALYALFKMNRAAFPPDSLRYLIALLNDESSINRWYTALIIGRLDMRDWPPDIRTSLFNAALAEIADSDDDIAMAMMEIIARANPIAARGIILNRLADMTRISATGYRVLGLLKPPGIDTLLLNMYGKNTWNDQYLAMQGMGAHADPAFDIRLLKTFSDETGQMESLCADAIARRRGGAVTLFKTILAGNDLPLKRRANRVLGRTADPRSVRYLMNALSREADPATRASLALALAELVGDDDILPLQGEFDPKTILNATQNHLANDSSLSLPAGW